MKVTGNVNFVLIKNKIAVYNAAILFESFPKNAEVVDTKKNFKGLRYLRL